MRIVPEAPPFSGGGRFVGAMAVAAAFGFGDQSAEGSTGRAWRLWAALFQRLHPNRYLSDDLLRQ